MSEARTINLRELREIITDPNELLKGTAFFDQGRLQHLSRFEAKLYGEAEGSGTAPYKVQVHFKDGAITGRCSCMAARSRPFCKHSAALLVAWARAPEGFVVAETAPAGAGGEPKKKQVKRGKADDQGLMREGVAGITTLVRELAVTGTAALDPVRIEQIRALGTNLREQKLRRLSARTLELSDRLTVPAEQADPVELAELLTDLLLTAKKLEKHLGGEVLEDRYVETLIGKTWRKTDRAPVEGLELLEYGYRTETTADDFVIRESRFLDLRSGAHYSEKQILPTFLAKRTPAKPSYFGQVLKEAKGSRYPGFAPHRLDLEDKGQGVPRDEAALTTLLERALPTVSVALQAFQEQRRDPFAPDLLPVALKVDTVLASGARLQLVDAADQALFLPSEIAVDDRFAAALRGGRLRAVLGDVGADGPLPTFYPVALVTEGKRGLALVPIGTRVMVGTKIDPRVTVGPRRIRWVETAKAAGLSGSAVALGEVKEELASVLGMGLPALSPRFVTPLVARLSELGLQKPGEVLKNASELSDASERLEGFVKVFQVLSVALVRLCGATPVERSTLAAVPTYDSVVVPAPQVELEPRAITQASARGAINRYEAAVHYARYYERVPPESLATELWPTWADGSATPYVVRALKGQGALGVQAAARALAAKKGRTAAFTALSVLEAIGSPEADRLLLQVESEHPDPGLRSVARRARRKSVDPNDKKKLEPLLGALFVAANRDDRVEALQKIEALADPEAIPYVRMSFAGDVSKDVREAAAYTLARLGDLEIVETLLRQLRDRREDPETAKIAAVALGHLGDVRGVDELLTAYAEGWLPGTMALALGALGVAALEPLVQRFVAEPELAERKAAQKVLQNLPAAEVGRSLVAQLEATAEVDRIKIAALFAQLAAGVPDAKATVRDGITRLCPTLMDGKSAAEKLLRRRWNAL